MTPTKLSTRFIAAALGAGIPLLLALLLILAISLIIGQRVQSERGKLLHEQAIFLASRLNGRPARQLAQQLQQEIATRLSQSVIYSSESTGLRRLGSDEIIKPEPSNWPNQPGWQIKRWPDGQVYLNGIASMAGNTSMLIVRQPLDLALAEIKQLQWDIFCWSIPLALLAAVLGFYRADRWQRRKR